MHAVSGRLLTDIHTPLDFGNRSASFLPVGLFLEYPILLFDHQVWVVRYDIATFHDLCDIVPKKSKTLVLLPVSLSSSLLGHGSDVLITARLMRKMSRFGQFKYNIASEGELFGRVRQSNPLETRGCS
jgi:hypothetical protein